MTLPAVLKVENLTDALSNWWAMVLENKNSEWLNEVIAKNQYNFFRCSVFGIHPCDYLVYGGFTCFRIINLGTEYEEALRVTGRAKGVNEKTIDKVLEVFTLLRWWEELQTQTKAARKRGQTHLFVKSKKENENGRSHRSRNR